MTDAPNGEIVVYQTPDGDVRVDVRLERDTVWLTQKQMSELFETSTDNVGLHLKNIFGDGELDERATTEDLSVVRAEGKRRVERKVKHYNLDAILSVGYRVHSKRGVRFRQWATATLREHLVRGFTVHRQRFEANARELQAALALTRKAADEIVEQIRRGRQAHAKSLGYDLKRVTKDLQLREKESGALLVERAPRAPQVESKRSSA